MGLPCSSVLIHKRGREVLTGSRAARVFAGRADRRTRTQANTIDSMSSPPRIFPLDLIPRNCTITPHLYVCAVLMRHAIALSRDTTHLVTPRMYLESTLPPYHLTTRYCILLHPPSVVRVVPSFPAQHSHFVFSTGILAARRRVAYTAVPASPNHFPISSKQRRSHCTNHCPSRTRSAPL